MQLSHTQKIGMSQCLPGARAVPEPNWVLGQHLSRVKVDAPITKMTSVPLAETTQKTEDHPQ